MTKRVLIVESEPWMGDQYERSLALEGFTVQRATNAHAAIELIDEDPPSAIIMSMLLSGTSGVGLLHELQTYSDTAGIPVVVCGNTSELTFDELEPYGVRRILDSSTMKPQDVPAAIRSVLV